jgi:Type II secretion system (T2SS), protein M subtype b
MTRRDRRALWIGVAIVVPVAVLIRVLPWGVRGVEAWRSHVRATSQTWARARALLATEPAIRDSLERALSQVVALAPKLVDGGTPAEASASLASLITLAASRRGLRVVRIDPLPDSAAGAFDRVTIHAELEGDLHGVVTLLAALETGEPLLTVPQLSVDAPAPGATRAAPEVLDVAVTVAGYALRRKAP